MVEEELVHGEGWISDDSSFYGSEDEQNHQYSLCQSFKPQRVWSAPKSDLNVLLAPSRSQRRSENMSCYSIDAIGDANFLKNRASNSSEEGDSKPMTFLLDRRAMEEARLARMGKRKREPSPEPVLFNLGQGSPDAWQLGESADDFVKRLPPLSTSVLTCTWIWVHNPHFDVRDKNKSTSHRAEEFRSHGADLLSQSLQARQQLQTKGLHGPRGPVTKSLNEESKALQQRINDLAVECEILSGKWMLFPKLEEVTSVWKKVVEGVIDNRLGPTAKVAPDEGKSGDRLICIYTKDFRDEEDVLRVLQELETMDLLVAGRSIYYKSDAFTYLDLYKQTASEYGLQASMYTSLKMMAAAKLSKAKSMSGKKQATLNSYF